MVVTQPSIPLGMCDTTLGMSLSPGKTELRRSALAVRRSIDLARLRDAGERLASHVDEVVQGCPPHGTVAAYISMGTEIPTLPLISALLDRDHPVIVPRLGAGLDLGWSAVDDLDALVEMPRTHSGGIRPREPAEAAKGPELLHEADLVVLPALAVDHLGTRLGRGGGWYDRALLHRRGQVSLLAVCWPWEISTTVLPSEPHDIPVDTVVTTRGVQWLA